MHTPAAGMTVWHRHNFAASHGTQGPSVGRLKVLGHFSDTTGDSVHISVTNGHTQSTVTDAVCRRSCTRDAGTDAGQVGQSAGVWQ